MFFDLKNTILKSSDEFKAKQNGKTTKIAREGNKIYVYKEKYYEKKAGKYAFERKDKLWLQNGHYHDAYFGTAFDCGHWCVVF